MCLRRWLCVLRTRSLYTARELVSTPQLKKNSILTDILFLFLDSVIFARLNKESQPLKKTTFVHLTVSNTHLYIINFIHLKVPIRFKGLHSLSNSLWSSSRWSINALMWLLGSSPNTPSHLENILWRILYTLCFFSLLNVYRIMLEKACGRWCLQRDSWPLRSMLPGPTSTREQRQWCNYKFFC